MTPVIQQDLRFRFGPARDQGPRPTCLAFAVSDTHAALRSPWSPLSCEFAFYHAQRRAGRSPSRGAALSHMLNALGQDGQPVETAWPYLPSTPANLDNYAPPGGVTVYRRLSAAAATNIDQIIGTLDGGNPVLAIIMLSDAFYAPNADGVVLPPSGEGPDPLRRHAVIAVAHGMVGANRAILVRNSWGTSWGLAGHAWLPEPYLAPRLTHLAQLTEDPDVPAQTLAA